MKVKIYYHSGEIKEIEALNPYHAHQIMLYSFLIDKDGTRTDWVVKAECKEIDALFHYDEAKKQLVLDKVTSGDFRSFLDEVAKDMIDWKELE